MENFGGGGKGNPNIELEIASLQGDHGYRMAQMQKEMRRLEREAENDMSRMDPSPACAIEIVEAILPPIFLKFGVPSNL